MDSVVDMADEVRPLVAACRDEMESIGRLPAPVAAQLASAGLMRMGVSAAVGGPQVHPVDMVGVIEALATVNPSAAWCVMISSTTSLTSGWMDQASAEEVFGDPLGIWAGTVAPMGTVTSKGDDVALTGRWSFGSGSQNATWMGGGALGPDGQHAFCLVPARDVTIIEDWDVVGLRGTGSHDWSVTAVDVPAGRVVALFSAGPVDTGPLYGMGLFGLLAAGIAAVGLGAGAASIDALVDLAGGKVGTFQTRPLARRTAVQIEVARATTALAAARSYLRGVLRDAFDQAAGGEPVGVASKAAVRRAATHAAETSAEVAASMFRLAGGTAIRNDAPFARLLCDTQAVCQHLMVGPATWEVTGQELLGLPVDRPDL